MYYHRNDGQQHPAHLRAPAPFLSMSGEGGNTQGDENSVLPYSDDCDCDCALLCSGVFTTAAVTVAPASAPASALVQAVSLDNADG